MIAIINYGVGNLYSISKAFELLGVDVKVTDKISTIRSASALILPGVGEFSSAMKNLSRSKTKEAIIDSVNNNKPLLGICLGMQMLFSESEEGNCKGLNLIKGRVVRFRKVKKIPHMGWNEVFFKKNFVLAKGMKNPSWMYFANSYYPKPDDKSVIAGKTKYENMEFCSIIQKGNIFGAQFHPEKSGDEGLKLLKNFIEYTNKRN